MKKRIAMSACKWCGATPPRRIPCPCRSDASRAKWRSGAHAQISAPLLQKLTVDRIAHFWERVDQSGGDDACWLWTGAVNEHGYGILNLVGKCYLANRVALTLNLGRELGSLQALHKCDNPPCCNPNHLFDGDPFTNLRDAGKKGRLSKRPQCFGGVLRPIIPVTECIRGHAYDERNTAFSIRKDGQRCRYCRACKREKARKRRARLTEDAA